jgi:copper chaperone NosL
MEIQMKNTPKNLLRDSIAALRGTCNPHVQLRTFRLLRSVRLALESLATVFRGVLKMRMAKITFAALVLFGLSACDQKEAVVQPMSLKQGVSCSLDGMLLMDYPGPKAQIHYDMGEPDFFCDTVEMFSIYLRPEQQKRIKAIYTHDMGKASWEAPREEWIDAKKAFYVLGSKKMGGMGPTLASFAKQEDAQAFAKTNGGKVLRFDEVTIDMVALDGGVLRDETMR